jgi:hypothetical protein
MRKVNSFGLKLENSESMKRYVADAVPVPVPVDCVADPSLFVFPFFVTSH